MEGKDKITPKTLRTVKCRIACQSGQGYECGNEVNLLPIKQDGKMKKTEPIYNHIIKLLSYEFIKDHLLIAGFNAPDAFV